MKSSIEVFLSHPAALVLLVLTLTTPAPAVERQPLHGHVPEAIARWGLQPIGRLPATNRLSLAIGLPLRNSDELNRLLQEFYDPFSPQFRHYLTVEQFTERFGPTPADYQAVTAFAKLNGLEVTTLQPNRMFVDVSGRVADVERALHMTMRLYQHPTEARTFYAPDKEPTLELAAPVRFIGGLNNMSLPRPLYKRNSTPPSRQDSQATALWGSGPSGSYMGNDFRAAYAPGVTLNGSGQVLGLLEGDGYFPSDIAQYETQAGLRNVPLTNVLLDGFHGIAFPGIGNNTEVALDIELAVAMAPGLSQIIVYEANLTGAGDGNGNSSSLLYDLLNRMATDNLAKQMSSSWEIDDDPLKTQIYQEFAMQGQSFFQASGDDGAYLAGSYHSGDNLFVTSVGGTTMTISGAGGPWTSETVWNWWSTGQGTNASGGGISVTNFPIPAYQQGISTAANGGSRTLRNVPDVAMTADNVYAMADDGQVEYVAGTSCAAPLWAAFTALVNQQAAQMGSNTVGFLNPALYAIGRGARYTADFHDITTGNNTNPASPSQFYATPGYDLCTGWGTPNGANLINDLAPLDTFVIAPSSGFAATGYVGGPFSGVSQEFTLTNVSATSLNWAAGTPSNWLKLSSSSGTLLPGGAAITVTISTNTAAASLPAGTYTSTVWFTNLSDGVVQTRQFSLQIQDDLEIIQAKSFSFTRLLVGTFPTTNLSFTLTNGGGGPVDWAVGNTSAWFNVTPSSGTLAPAGFTTATVSLTPAAISLGVGSFTNTFWFTNLNDGFVQDRSVVITVWPWIVNGGFETADFTGWDLSGNTAGLRVTSKPNKVHSGGYGAAFGSSGSLGYISQAVPTAPGGRYLLSLWLHSPDGQTPNQFEVIWNGVTLYKGVNLPALPWTNLQFVVSASATSTLLQIGGRDDPTALGLDDVSIVSVMPPIFRSVAKSGDTLTLAWSGQVGLTYQVQYNTGLEPSVWTNLGSAITATNGTILRSDSIVPGGNTMHFYRVLLVP